MKLFECQNCGQLLYFENTRCERCGHVLGYLPETAVLSPLTRADGRRWRPLAAPETCSSSAPMPGTTAATGWCQRTAGRRSAGPAATTERSRISLRPITCCAGSVSTETITLDDKRGDLTAVGEVVSTLPLTSSQTDRQAKPTSSIGRGAEFKYDDASRRATYTKRAQLNGPEGNLSGDRIDLVLAANENALDRLEASGTVRVILDKREATGMSLTYHPDDARYVLVGTPARFVEECRENTGKTLTFFRSSDRIVIDGNEETRTQTRGGGKCPEPRIE